MNEKSELKTKECTRRVDKSPGNHSDTKICRSKDQIQEYYSAFFKKGRKKQKKREYFSIDKSEVTVKQASINTQSYFTMQVKTK